MVVLGKIRARSKSALPKPKNYAKPRLRQWRKSGTSKARTTTTDIWQILAAALRTALHWQRLEMTLLLPVLVVVRIGKSIVNCLQGPCKKLLQQACAPNLSPLSCNAKAVVCWTFLRSASVLIKTIRT